MNERKHNQDFGLANPLVMSAISCCSHTHITENEMANITKHMLAHLHVLKALHIIRYTLLHLHNRLN